MDRAYKGHLHIRMPAFTGQRAKSIIFSAIRTFEQGARRTCRGLAVGSPSGCKIKKWSSRPLLAGLLLLAMPDLAAAQGSAVRSLITQGVDETKLATLRGNTHPLARAEFDRGAAPASLAMDHMLLVLKRTPEQEADLKTLLAQQLDKTSPNYHNWLTPGQFGQQFGPSDQDIQTITSWLRSHGFQNVNVSNGRTTVDFSGTAGQVEGAFHTAIHKYVLASGEEYCANAGDPQIPSALNVVVAGVNSLNNFPKKPLHHTRGVVRRSTATGQCRAKIFSQSRSIFNSKEFTLFSFIKTSRARSLSN